MKILFVCLGNICRSPVAEGVFRFLTEEQGCSDQYEVDSCGTAAYHIGEQPDDRMRRTATKHGVTLNHQARQISQTDLEVFDIVFAMDSANYTHILQMSSSAQEENKIKLLRDYDPEAKGVLDVPDPYYGGINGFEEVFQIAYRSSKNFLINNKG